MLARYLSSGKLGTHARAQARSFRSTTITSAQTHFGFRSVDEEDKAGLVKEVFESVASKYVAAEC